MNYSTDAILKNFNTEGFLIMDTITCFWWNSSSTFNIAFILSFRENLFNVLTLTINGIIICKKVGFRNIVSGKNTLTHH